MGAYITEQDITGSHAFSDIAQDALRLHGICVVFFPNGVFPQHFIPEGESSFRFLNSCGQLRKMPQRFGHISHDLDGRRIAAVDMGRSCTDMDDCFIQPGIQP